MRNFALALLESRSPLYDRAFRRSINSNFDSEDLPPSVLLEPAWLKTQVRLPAHLPLCVAYQRRPNLRKAPPHPLFDTTWYLAQNPSATTHPLGALGHYLEVGEKGGLAPSPLWSPKDGALTKALKSANSFLANQTTQLSGHHLTSQNLTLLFWNNPIDALAQAKALAATRWPYEVFVVLPKPGASNLKHSLTATERVALSSAIALLSCVGTGAANFHTAKTSWVFDGNQLIGEISKASNQAPRWLVTLVGSPTITSLERAKAVLHDLPRARDEVFINFTESQAGSREIDGWGEVLMFPDSIFEAVSLESSKTHRQAPEGQIDFVNLAIGAGVKKKAFAIAPEMDATDESLWQSLRFVTEIHQRTDRLRWFIKTPVTSAAVSSNWGDTWFAQDLAAALRSLGQFVTIDSQSSQGRSTQDLCDVNLVLQGRWNPEPLGEALNLLWLISNPQMADIEMLAKFDGVFVASDAFTARLRSAGIAAETLFQCTNPEKFRPVSAADLADRIDPLVLSRLARSALFVGGARSGGRPIVTDALTCSLPIMVFGHGWADTLTPNQLIETHLPNVDLPYFYQAARVVLADHEESMRVNGFISNRIFDAAATGARVVCDQPVGEPSELKDLFGASVRTYSSVGQLRGLLIDPEQGWPPSEFRRQNALGVGAENSFYIRAKHLLDRAIALRNIGVVKGAWPVPLV